MAEIASGQERQARIIGSNFGAERLEAERRFPFIKKFRNVAIAPARVENKGGMGEFVEPDHPTNPNPGQFTITIGKNSKNLQGGVADTIIADMIHAAAQFSPEFQQLKKELMGKLGKGEIALARRHYDKAVERGETGSNFATFDNYLNRNWVDGIVQHLLLPENSEIKQIRRASPDAVSVLDKIEKLFRGKGMRRPVNQ